MMADSHKNPASPSEPVRESAFDVLEREERRRIRNKWIVLLCVPPLVGLITILVLFLLPPSYQASGTVRLGGGLGGPSGKAGFSKRDFRDEIALLSAHGFRRHVLEQLSPQDRALLLHQQRGAHFAAKHPDGKGAGSELALRTGIRVTGNLDTAMLVITDENDDPALAAALTNAAIRAIQQNGTDAGLARSRTVQAFFAPRIAELQDLIHEEQHQEEGTSEDAAGEAEVVATRSTTAPPSESPLQTQLEARAARKHGNFQHTDQREAITFDQLPDQTALLVIEREATRAKLEARLEQARLKLLQSVQSQDPDSFDRLTDDAFLRELQRSLASAQATYDQMAATLGQNNPDMLKRAQQLAALRTQIAAVRQEHERAARIGVTGAQQHAAALDAQLTLERRKLERILAAQQSSAILEINLAINLTLLADLRQKLDEYPIDAALNAPLVEVVDYAVQPSQAVTFPVFRTFFVGSTAGFFLSVLIIAVMQLRGRRLWSLFSLENAAGRPVLALLKQTARPELTPDFDEPLREVRSALQLMRGAQPSMTVVLTSSRGGEGTTTLVSALALLLARSGERVLLLDANLYRPALHRHFNLPGRIGLSQALTGGATLAQSTQNVSIEGPGLLDVVASGPMPPTPSELLQSVAFDDLLRHARQHYSFILLDSAPAGAPLGMLSMAVIDAVFLTVRYNTVDLRQIRYTQRHLTRAPLRALLVNGIPQGRLRPNPT